MRHTVRSWRIHRRTPATLDELAQQCNTTIQGWWNYYGAFYRTAMHSLFSYIDLRLMRWARRKYKRLRLCQVGRCSLSLWHTSSYPD
ncbi:group II intron maturase-specific domain-containing protein [Paraburkholderia sp. BR14263]|uniref:group II intron maturase-specific domain-containing protein n=1 Tax=unclassified Paraburkholderia TaxID=2615204 RepID=UPI0034CDB53F